MNLEVRAEKMDTLRRFADNLTLTGDADTMDTLATFNYDLVLEAALWELGKWTPNAGYLNISRFELEGTDIVTEGIATKVPPSPCCVLKLHGSVNWESARNAAPWTEAWCTLRNREKPWQPWQFRGIETHLFSDPTKVPDIGRDLPYWRYDNVWVAPSMMKNIPEDRLLAANWRTCQRAMSEAVRLVAIGYSFPEQDTASRLLLTLLRDGAHVTIIGPQAKEIAQSIQHLVKGEVVPHDTGFSRWVQQGCHFSGGPP
jgi:hypothetical protein